MSDIRSLIREILSEEIASLRTGFFGEARIERVDVATTSELTEFALSILRRAEDPRFVAELREGRLRFEPHTVVRTSVPPRAPAVREPETVLVTTVPATTPELRKGLITERDIAGVSESESRLRIMKQARLTPLARDEARRRGIRIERTLS